MYYNFEHKKQRNQNFPSTNQAWFLKKNIPKEQGKSRPHEELWQAKGIYFKIVKSGLQLTYTNWFCTIFVWLSARQLCNQIVGLLNLSVESMLCVRVVASKASPLFISLRNKSGQKCVYSWGSFARDVGCVSWKSLVMVLIWKFVSIVKEAELSLKNEFFLEKSLVVFVFINTREMLEEHWLLIQEFLML